ncbi:MAG TPA: polysaccharide biosynthesis/export family protein [Bryobacteraceae bacterium]|nr:polysaccharide biosynthesis/export family protein [Bryobacteraceae bacterium]
MITRAFGYKTGAAVLLAALGIMVSGAAQTEKAPPKELLQYIYDAKGRGVNDARIRRDAVAVGWESAIVDEAIAYAKKSKPPHPVAPAADGAAIRARQSIAPTPVAAAPAALLGVQRDPLPVAGQSQPADPKDIPTGGRGVPDDYLIGSGDTLQISVWKEPDVSVPSVVVRPGGMITVPLIKDVEVEGLTPRQVEKVIADGLGKFIIAPNVTVVVTASNSKKIYVVGAVRAEGPLLYTYRMTVLQALSEAGGLTDYAKRKRIYIIRSESGKDYRLDFNYDEVVQGQRMEQNIQLQPGDTIVIPH